MYNLNLSIDYPEIEHIPEYLSPTSFINAISNPCKFYLQRLKLAVMPKDKQEEAASIGSAFDGLIKRKVFEFHNLPYSEEDLFKGVEKEDKNVYIQKAIRFHNTYLAYLKFLGIDLSYFKRVEIDEIFKYKGIPLRGKLDCTVLDGNKEIPLDWKLSGSVSSASPKPGYKIKITNYRNEGSHKNYIKDMPFEQIDSMWAIQLCIYGWLLGHTDNFKGVIHQISQTSTGTIQLSIYEGTISVNFQEKLIRNISNLWEMLHDNSYIFKMIKSYSNNIIYLRSLSEKWYNFVHL